MVRPAAPLHDGCNRRSRRRRVNSRVGADIFSVALYKPKQGDYWMAQDDTAVHWREKSIMRAILDREDIPDIRTFVAHKAAELLAAAGGSMDAVPGLTRAVPLALVQIGRASCRERV